MKKIILSLVLLGVASMMYAGIGGGTKRALIVAIGNYDASSGWPSFDVDNDVVFLKAALNNYSFKDENIIVLRDSKATCEGIWRVLDSLLTVTKKGDVYNVTQF